MLQYYILTNVIIALFFMLEFQRAIRWGVKEAEIAGFVGVLVLAIIIIVPWITYSCETFKYFKC